MQELGAIRQIIAYYEIVVVGRLQTEESLRSEGLVGLCRGHKQPELNSLGKTPNFATVKI